MRRRGTPFGGSGGSVGSVVPLAGDALVTAGTSDGVLVAVVGRVPIDVLVAFVVSAAGVVVVDPACLLVLLHAATNAQAPMAIRMRDIARSPSRRSKGVDKA
jgi:hypothetical protein